jgi:hypothetical protein
VQRANDADARGWTSRPRAPGTINGSEPMQNDQRTFSAILFLKLYNLYGALDTKKESERTKNLQKGKERRKDKKYTWKILIILNIRRINLKLII